MSNLKPGCDTAFSWMEMAVELLRYISLCFKCFCGLVLSAPMVGSKTITRWNRLNRLNTTMLITDGDILILGGRGSCDMIMTNNESWESLVTYWSHPIVLEKNSGWVLGASGHSWQRYCLALHLPFTTSCSHTWENLNEWKIYINPTY